MSNSLSTTLLSNFSYIEDLLFVDQIFIDNDECINGVNILAKFKTAKLDNCWDPLNSIFYKDYQSELLKVKDFLNNSFKDKSIKLYGSFELKNESVAYILNTFNSICPINKKAIS